MRERIVPRPAVEIRPPFVRMRAEQVAGGEKVLGKGERAVEVVIGAVCQGVRRAVAAPGPSAVEQSTQKFEGGDVNVCVHKAQGLGRAPGAKRRRRAFDVHRYFGERGTTGSRVETPPRTRTAALNEAAVP